MMVKICSSKQFGRLSERLKRSALAAVIAAGVASGVAGAAHAQGIPVIDATSLIQHIQQVQELQAQLQQAKELYDLTTNLHDSFNQITNVSQLAGLLNNPQFQQYLPQEYSQYASAVSGLLQGNVQGFAEQYDYYTREGASAANDFYNQELLRRRAETYQDMAVGEVVYDQASQRLEQLNQLKDSLASATTPKEVMDLQARLQAESAILSNEILRLQGLAMIQEARTRVDEQREDERIQEMNDQIRAALGGSG